MLCLPVVTLALLLPRVWADLSTTPTVVRKLNTLYKASVVSCQGLRLRLERFFLDKQRLLDRVHSITAEKLIFSHAVQMVGLVGVRSLPGTALSSPGPPPPGSCQACSLPPQ